MGAIYFPNTNTKFYFKDACVGIWSQQTQYKKILNNVRFNFDEGSKENGKDKYQVC